MKKSIVLFGVMSMLALASCNNKTEEVKTATSPVEQAQPQTPPPASTGQKEGTVIKINEGGVSVENKSGSSKSNVKITKDTTNIELSRPK